LHTLHSLAPGRPALTSALLPHLHPYHTGTLLTAQLALRHGLACNTAGGTHHAHASHGGGFCILNDLAVTAEVLLQQGSVQRVLILDLDVHQGDGTASIFKGRQDVFTLSVHCQSNYPYRKPPSHMDVGLPDGTDDVAYLRQISEILPGVLQDFRPDIVLYDAGVDVHVDDALGKLCVSDEGLMRRELLVMDTCLAEGIPLAGYVGGGYAADLDVLADRHIWLHLAAEQMWRDYSL
jgi:acetoin utilization deacetylase AcuC-like enzyme